MDAIDSFIPKYEELHPVGIRYALDEASGFHEGRLDAKHPPFLDFGLEVGEFSYQLRSALDNIVYALSAENLPGEIDSPERKSAERVPFFNVLRVSNDDAIREHLRYVPDGIREDVFASIDKHQPYKREADTAVHPLSVVNELNLQDKHRVVNAAVGNITVDVGDLPDGVEFFGGTTNTGDLVVKVPDTLNPQEVFHPRLAFRVIVQLGTPSRAVEVTSLRGVLRYIEDELMPDFIGFFPPES